MKLKYNTPESSILRMVQAIRRNSLLLFYQAWDHTRWVDWENATDLENKENERLITEGKQKFN